MRWHANLPQHGAFLHETTPLPEPFNPTPPLVIGLLGGVAAGKSAVAAAMAAHGLKGIDADVKAREATEDPGIQSQLEDRFGADIMNPDGKLDRQALAREVFDNPEARQDLEAILHPVIRREITRELREAFSRGTSVVLDAPLLLEGGLIDRCDVCIFVEATTSVRRKRVRDRGWQDGEMERREAVQAPLSVKNARCAYTIMNDGPLTDIAQKVAAALQRIASRPTPRK